MGNKGLKFIRILVRMTAVVEVRHEDLVHQA